jgi:hypothetical protein
VTHGDIGQGRFRAPDYGIFPVILDAPVRISLGHHLQGFTVTDELWLAPAQVDNLSGFS